MVISSYVYSEYHDNEWGIPMHDEINLFEILILEGAQAGLSWEIVLKKRAGYKKAFHGFDPRKIVNMSDNELKELYKKGNIILNS